MNQQHIGLMFSMVITPMIFFGCTYYPWSALKTFPILQKAVLINPLVYASEGLRATLVPQFPHLSTIAILIALLFLRRSAAGRRTAPVREKSSELADLSSGMGRARDHVGTAALGCPSSAARDEAFLLIGAIRAEHSQARRRSSPFAESLIDE